MSQQVIRVSEHQVLRVGTRQGSALFDKNHLALLEQMTSRYGQQYFSLVPEGVRFKQYVGAIGLGNLTIEILPKLQDAGDPTAMVWQKILLGMLAKSTLVEGKWLTDARLRPEKASSMLEWCIAVFLKQIRQFVQHGLPKGYARMASNAKVQRGRLLVAQQVRYNYIRKERFFADRQYYTYDYPLNQMVRAALEIVGSQLTGNMLQTTNNAFLRLFREMGVSRKYRFDWEQIRRAHTGQSLQKLIDWCELILRHYQPAIRSGTRSLMAILFDMQALFEDYLYRVLLEARPENFQVLRQQSRPFWKGQHIRPDILLMGPEIRWVIDTKWKQLEAPRPAAQDLKQLYVYARYFGAKRAVLLYPATSQLRGLFEAPYAVTEEDQQPPICQLIFVDLIADHSLNHNLGKDLFLQIQGHSCPHRRN